jgi:hypothetical protein
MGRLPRTQESGGKMGALEDAIASGDSQAMARLSPLFANAQYTHQAQQGMAPGAQADPRAPQGMSFADPAQLAAYVQSMAQQNAAMAQGQMMDRAMRERDQQQQAIMKIASGLDPELQAMVMQRLGMQPQQGFQGPEKRKLESAKELATHNDTLKSDDMEARLLQAYAKMAQQSQQFNQQQGIRQQVANQGDQRIGIQQQAEDRKQQTAAMPSWPPKMAQEVMDKLSSQGAAPDVLAAAAERMGYAIGPEGYNTGMFGQNTTPVMGRRGIQSRDGQAAGAKAPGKGKMRLRDKATGAVAVGPEGPVPEGMERIN